MNLRELQSTCSRYLKALYDETGGDLAHRCVWCDLEAPLSREQGLPWQIANFWLSGIPILPARVREVESV